MDEEEDLIDAVIAYRKDHPESERSKAWYEVYYALGRFNDVLKKEQILSEQREKAAFEAAREKVESGNLDIHGNDLESYKFEDYEDFKNKTK